MLLFVLLAVLLGARAFYLQVLCADEWRERAAEQHRKIIKLTPQRGGIYDRNGEPLAISLEADSIYIDPAMYRQGMEQGESGATSTEHADKIATALGLRRTDVLQKMRMDRRFVWLRRRVTQKQADAVAALQIPGVDSIKEHKRWYPNGRLAGQIVGFSGVDNYGLEGLERYYNSILAGGERYLVTRKDAMGRSFGTGRQVLKGKQGRDLYLTIDKLIQHVAEREIKQAVQDSKARHGMVLVLEPNSADVLAMASYPDFDPNSFSKYSAARRRNRVVCDAYEPGSTFKVFTMAAALEEGVVKPDTPIDCERGAYRVGGKTIHDYKAMKVLPVRDVFKYSSNIGTAKIAAEVGKQRFYHYLHQFGFGTRTGLKFDGEAAGILRPASQWFPVDLAAISFGQGVTVTPLQLGRALCAVVNGGELLTPHLVKRIEDREHNQSIAMSPQVETRVISAETAAMLRNMMVRVTADDGTGSRAQVPGFAVGGKTGTAQKVDRVTGGYSPDKHVSSFAGFAPAQAPRLVVLVVLDEPEGEAYGGLLAAPVFAKIVEQSLRYLHVPANPDKAGRKSKRWDRPTPHTHPALGPQLLQVGNTADTMPDFQGMSARQVLLAMERTGLNVSIQGRGRVVKQNPSPGDHVSPDTRVSVVLQPPE